MRRLILAGPVLAPLLHHPCPEHGLALVLIPVWGLAIWLQKKLRGEGRISFSPRRLDDKRNMAHNKLTTDLNESADTSALGADELALLEACKAATEEDLAGEEIDLDEESTDARF